MAWPSNLSVTFENLEAAMSYPFYYRYHFDVHDQRRWELIAAVKSKGLHIDEDGDTIIVRSDSPQDSFELGKIAGRVFSKAAP